jgi:pimeloyl-ACP methyl ester carboxylesterase
MNLNTHSRIWDSSERSGLAPIQDSLEYLIDVPLQPKPGENEERFGLYYFVHTPVGPPTFKSVLFCAGGPGQIVRTFDRSKTYADYLSKNGYNVVFFHLRGTGFSQIPPSIKDDRFLRCQYAIHDMEAIRCHFHEQVLGGKNVKWEAVIGWSFGTVLAQLYAHSIKDSVKRLVLISPLSRHRFKESATTAFEEYYYEMLRIYRETLGEIYTSKKETLQNEFGDMTPGEIIGILDQLFEKEDGVLQKTEEAFGSIQSVVDSYTKLADSKFPDGKKYSRTFYQSLRDLRFCGSNSIDETGGMYEKQRLIGKILRDELLGRNTQDHVRRDQGRDLIENMGRSQNSNRAYYSFGVRDGINWAFLKEYTKAKNFDNAVRAIGGRTQLNPEETQALNASLEKIVLDTDETVEAWDPRKYWHEVPTLILNGGADPVTAGGQAERYYHSEPIGSTTLIVFPGIGHNISLGGTEIEGSQEFEVKPPLLNGAIHIVPPEIPPGEVREVTGTAKGWCIDETLRIELVPPQNLREIINIHGCGIHGPRYDPEKSGYVVALIENKGDADVTIDDSDWKLETKLFWGTVRFSDPDPIPKGKIRLVYGSLVYGERNKKAEYYVRPKKNLEEGLKLVGYILKPPASVELWIRNDNDKAKDQTTGDWTIENETFRRTFKVNLPEIKPQQTKSVVWGIDGFSVSVNDALMVERPDELPSTLVACLQPQGDRRRLSFTVWNQDKEKSQRVGQSKWSVRSAAFSVTVDLDSFELAPGAVTTVEGDVRGMEWVKCLDFKPANYPEPPLQLVSYNIKSENQVSMLLRNTSTRSITGTHRDWIYVIPTSNANLVDLNQALNALIFSFLVLEPEHFYNRKENEILDRVLQKFERANLRVTIEPQPIGN